MKILLTGASGFIGKSYLENTRNNKIFTLSRSELHSEKTYKHYVGDLSEKKIRKNIASEKFDLIIHGAWGGLPDRTESANAKNCKIYSNIIEELSSFQNTNHIFLGSCLEYGTINSKVSENISGIDIDNFGETKLNLLNQVIQSGMNYNWLRIFYVFGPYQHPNSLIKSICDAIRNDDTVRIQNPTKAHDFIFIKEVIELIDMFTFQTPENGIYNIGTGTATSIGQIANIILQLFNKKPQFLNSKNESLIADMDKIYKTFGWTSNYNLKLSIEETVQRINLD